MPVNTRHVSHCLTSVLPRFANAGRPVKINAAGAAVLVHTAQHHLCELQLLENRVGSHLGFILRQYRFHHFG
jgi:hypothetical protein